MNRGNIVNANRHEHGDGQDIDTSKVFKHVKIILPAKKPVKRAYAALIILKYP
jgi:hypothetical protein